jgi:hypothetical protein
MQAPVSQQVSLLTPRPSPGTAGSVRAYAGVAQLVEHLFCKQVVSGSIPLASSSEASSSSLSFSSSLSSLTETSEGCPSGQREQAVNLPAHAYVGSNPTPSTAVVGSSAPPRWIASSGSSSQVLGPQPQNSRRVSLARRGSPGMRTTEISQRGMQPAGRGFNAPLDSAGVTQLVESQFSKLKVGRRRELSSRPAEVNSAGPHPQVLGPQPQNGRHSEATIFAGVTQLVESQFSKLKVDGSSPFSRSMFLSVSRFSATHQTSSRTLKQTRSASLCAGEVEARTGAERTPVREHRTGAETQPARKIAGRADSQVNASAHLAQLVEHVLGKDEVTSSSLVVGSNLQP